MDRDQKSNEEYSVVDIGDYASEAQVIVVDPRNTSKACPACKHVSRKNRIKRDLFLCDE